MSANSAEPGFLAALVPPTRNLELLVQTLSSHE